MGNQIRIGIVGLGRAGAGFHIPDMLARQDQYTVVAACDIIKSRAEATAQKCGCPAYDNMEDFLRNEDIEVVDIATRSCDHYEHALQALAAGKDVMLEKPVCMNRDQLADLLSRTNKPGLPKLILRHNRRFEPGFVEMKRIVDSGILGDVFEFQLSEYGYQFRDDWQTLSEFGGGQLLNWGPHLIDHALQFLGSPVKRMHCDNIQAVAGGDCEDHFSIRLSGENGRFVTVSVSGSAALNQGRVYTAIGTRGQAVMHDTEIHLRYIDPTMELPTVVSNPGTPGEAFGASGTYASKVQPKWVTEDRTVAPPDHKIILDRIYESYRNGAEFPIRDSEILALMDVLTKAKEQELIRADSIR